MRPERPSEPLAVRLRSVRLWFELEAESVLVAVFVGLHSLRLAPQLGPMEPPWPLARQWFVELHIRLGRVSALQVEQLRLERQSSERQQLGSMWRLLALEAGFERALQFVAVIRIQLVPQFALVELR